jgi:hypothetical protein
MSLFAALYPRAPFQNLEDFVLFIRYTSSIQQFLIRDGEADLDWFIPETPDEAIPKLLNDLGSATRVSGPSARERLLGLHLPMEFDWTADLSLLDVLVDASDDGLELSAMAEEGYLSVFAVQE